MPTINVTNTIRPVSIGRSFLDEYGDNLSVGLSLQDLGGGTAVTVFRNLDDSEADFTGAKISDGTLVDWVYPKATITAPYDDLMYFDGTDDYVQLASDITLSGDFDIQFKCYLNDPDDEEGVMMSDNDGTGNTRLFYDGGSNLFGFYDSTGSFKGVSYGSFPIQQVVQVRVTRASGTLTYYVNGSSVGTNTSANNIVINRIGGERGSSPSLNNWKGMIWDIDINSVASYDGDGTADGNWEDQTGSNDGTVNGSPVLFSGQGCTGTVPQWWDASGESNDAIQITQADQPAIVEDGVLLVDSEGLPRLDFKTDRYMEVADAFDFDTSLSVSSVVQNKLADIPDGQFFVGQYDTGFSARSWTLGFWSNEKIYVLIGDSGGAGFFGARSASSGSSIENKNVIGMTFAANDMDLLENGSEVAATGASPASIVNSTRPLLIGCYGNAGNPTNHWDGYMQEVLVYGATKSDITDIQDNQKTRWEIS